MYISDNAPADAFALTFKNLSNIKQSMELFQLGLANLFTPHQQRRIQNWEIDTTAFVYANYFAVGVWTNFASLWKNGALGDNSNENCVWNTGVSPTTIVLVQGNGGSSTFTIPTGSTININGFNDLIETAMLNNIANGWETQGSHIRYDFNGNFPLGSTWLKGCFGITAWNDDELVVPTLLGIQTQSITIGADVWGTPQSISTWTKSFPILLIAENDIEVVSAGGMGYEEINRSQNGAFMDIRGVSIQVLPNNIGTAYNQNSQTLNSLGFVKLNARGDDYLYYSNPTISPYQTQNVVNDIDMDDKSGLFVLDGNTRFDYSLEPLTDVQLVFDYAQFPNFLLKYGWNVANKIIDIRQGKQDAINKENAYGRKVVLDIKETDGGNARSLLNYIK